MPIADMPRLGLGTFSNDDDDWADIVQRALDVGYRHIDTAQAYGNHEAVGEGIASSDVDRDDVFLATKSVYPGLPDDPNDVGDAIDTCLAELGVDYVDLLYVHWPSGAYEPEPVLSAYNDAHEAGKIRHVGLSNFTPALLDEAREYLDVPLAAHQVEMHLLLQQETLVEYAQEHDHWLVAYSPLAKGNVLEMPAVQTIAESHGATPAQVALAWLLSQESVAAVPKASTQAHLEDNFGATEVELTVAERETLASLGTGERVVDPERAPWNW